MIEGYADVNLRYDPAGPKIGEFHRSDERRRLIFGPVGCVSGDTQIITEDGLQTIESLDRPTRVLSWNDKTNQFQLSQATASFPKGKDYLYRVSTTNGVWRAAGHHLVLCSSGKYRSVESLRVGDLVSRCDPSLLAMSREASPLSSPLSGGRCLEKDEDFQTRCEGLGRRYGQQPLARSNAGLTCVPSQGDVRISGLISLLAGDQVESEQSRIHQNLCASRSGIGGSFHHASILAEVEEDSCSSVFCSHSGEKAPRSKLSQMSFLKNPIDELPPVFSRSYSYSLYDGAVLSITRTERKVEYWDIQVAGTNNYVTYDGCIHHNSGKSVAGCWEVLRRGFEMPPCIDGIRRSRYAIVRNCYDDQTEILTEKRSWQPFKELRPDDKVAQLNGDAMEFVLPSYWHAAPYEGEMFGFEGEAVDYLVTPDHKMHVSKIETRKRKWSDYRFETAERVHDAYGFRVRRDAEWIGDDPGMTKDMFEFLGFFFAEGSTSSFIDSQGTHRRILQVTQCKPLGIVYCRDLLKRAGVDHYENARQDTGINFRVKTGAGYVGSDLFDLLSPLGKCTELSIPECILSATKAHLQAFLHGFTMGDGTVTASGVTELYTSSEALAGNLQEVVVKAGKVATVHLRRDMVVGAPVTIKGVKTAATAKAWTVAVSSPAKNRPRLQRKTGDGTRYKGFYREQYNGHVYCLTVPSHVVYVRRNGKAFWCGQTFSDLERTTIKTWEAQFLHAFGKPVSRRAGIVHEIHRNVGDGTKVQIEVMFFSMDRPDDVKRLLSYEISGAFVNEAREIPKAIFEALDDRVTRYPAKEMLPPGVIPFFGWWADTNPPDRDHWIYETFENEKPPGWVMFRQPGGLVHDGYEWKENPKAENLLNLTLGARYYTEAMSGKSEDHIRVYYGAEYGYVKEGRLVIGDFNETWNSSDVTLKFDPNIETIYVGIDFGATPAAAFLQLGTNGQWKCIEEMQSEKTGTGPFAADRLKPRLLELESLGHKIIMTGDPAGSGTSETDGRTPFKMLADNNILCNPAFSNAFNLRMEILRGLCRSATEGQPKFLLSHACKIARRGLAQKFVFKRVGVQTEEGQKYQVLPDKNEFSHIIDAIIYGIMGSGEGKQIGQSHVKGGKLAYKKIN